MSRSARIAVIAATVVVLVLAFVVLSPGDDEPATTTPTATTATNPPPPAATSKPPSRSSILVRAGKPVGGVEKIKVKKGSRVQIEISSADTTDEIHLHGYDIKRELKAGGEVRFLFTAKSDGIYEIELEGAGAQIAELVVEP